MKPYVVAMLAGASLVALVSPAVAQQSQSRAAPNASEDEEGGGEIVVTGTLVRGVAPTGANVLGLGAQNIDEAGISTGAEIMELLPQFGAFNSVVAPSINFGANSVPVIRPNLRSLPGSNVAGSSTTLVLVDGHRVVGMGVSSTTPDPDVVPAGALERVEIVPDGGSAIYGSDAVAGVINYITRREFDGVQADARYGLGDEYDSFDAGLTAGRSWGSGSALVSYNYAEHSGIWGRDRDWVRQPLQLSNGLNIRDLACAPGNVVDNSNIYALPYGPGFPAASTQATLNDCDVDENSQIYPEQTTNAVLGRLSQELSGTLELDVVVNFLEREIDSVTGPFTSNNTVTAASGNPFFASHATIAGDVSHVVHYQFGGPNAGGTHNELTYASITPTLTVDLPSGWQLRFLGSYGQSEVLSRQRSFNATALTNALAGQGGVYFNPYDPASNPAGLIATITNWEIFQQGEQELTNFRVIADGDLVQLPGGAVKLAIGAEYSDEQVESQSGSGIPGRQSVATAASAPFPAVTAIPRFSLGRDITSAFGEVVIPIFGEANAQPWIDELTLSLSARYDSYSDAGETVNPRVGLTYNPVDWITLRGSWGESFNAPSLIESPAVSPPSANLVGSPNVVGIRPPANQQTSGGGTLPNFISNGTSSTGGTGQIILAISGTAQMTPQTAETWSLGFDISPPFIPGLDVSATYYHIQLDNRIGRPPLGFSGTQTAAYWREYTNTYTLLQGTAAQNDAAVASALAGVNLNGATVCTGNLSAPAPANSYCVYAIADTRTQNLGSIVQEGVDFNIRYAHDVSWGSFDLGLNGTYQTNDERKAAAASPFTRTDHDFGSPHLRYVATVGADIENFRAQASWQHTDGYDLLSPLGIAALSQGSIDAFDVMNLFFRYNLPEGLGVTDNLSLTLNVQNALNAEPPNSEAIPAAGNVGGFTNGNTLGRVFLLGVNARF